MQGGSGKLRRLLFGLIAALACAGTAPGADVGINVLSTHVWDMPQPWFGGFSGMEVSENGETLTLITDRGSLVTARLTRVDGSITEARVLSRKALRHRNGQIIKGSVRDAEGLAIGTDGRAYVSFENRHRVALLDLRTGITRSLPAHPDFEGFPVNGGLEALAVHPDGRLITLAEQGAQSDGTIPLYSFQEGRWRISHHLPSRGPFLPVGADIDAQGRLYLLERAVTPLGFRSRLRRFHLDVPNPVAETLFTSIPGSYDNLEAVAVWSDPEGRTRLLLMSDDNFLPFQRTEIVEVVLTE